MRELKGGRGHFDVILVLQIEELNGSGRSKCTVHGKLHGIDCCSSMSGVHMCNIDHIRFKLRSACNISSI